MKMSAEELAKVSWSLHQSDLCPCCKRGRKLLVHITTLESELATSEAARLERAPNEKTRV